MAMQTKRNRLDFTGQKIYAGIDVHKKDWTVCIFSDYLEHKKFSQAPSAKELKAYLEKNFPGASYYSAYESGFCGFHVHRQLEEAGIKNIVVNAADVPVTHKEKTNKTDKRDSRKLGNSLRSGALTGIYIPTRKTQEDRSLLRMRYGLSKDLTRLKLRIKSLLHFYGIEHPAAFTTPSSHWTRRYMQWLGTLQMEEDSGRAVLDTFIGEVIELHTVLLSVTGKIRELSRTASYAQKFALLSGIPGIGLITGMSFLTETEDMNRFASADRFASFVGLIPSSHSSGEKENNGRITSRAHFLLREMIIESAWKAVRFDPALHLTYCNLTERMPPNKAIVRIGRKLLNRIYHVLKTGQAYTTGFVEPERGCFKTV
jgi:transposase